MILAPRKHLFATNIIIFFVIMIVQKCIQLFCIIEEKACSNANCTPENRCDERCVVTSPADQQAGPPPPPPSPVKEGAFTIIPVALRKAMRNFGYGEGHFNIFVEEKTRYGLSKARLNAAVAEVKLNPN